jgi:mitochondrial fission protein ELM1
MADAAPVWVLLGHRTGDNNQLLRLAGELGLPFRTLQLSYNRLHLAPQAMLGASLASLDPESRRLIQPPWPDLVLGIGNRSAPAALAIRRLSGNKAKLVRLGNPRSAASNFDLVITTAQYSVPDAPNVVRLPAGISTVSPAEPTPEEREWLDKLPRPHRLLLIGGDTFMWHLRASTVANAASLLSRKHDGSVIAVSSGRTGRDVPAAVTRALFASDHGLVWGRFPRYAVLLEDADEIAVTADSVAMMSDAIATGKPVGLVKPRMTAAGRLFYGLESVRMSVPVRDIRRFWRSVQAQGLAGPVEHPKSGKLAVDPLATAVAAVRTLLES